MISTENTIAQPKQVWPLVIKDMINRNEEGAKKYNRYLQTDCPDQMLQHAYEEALDLAVYLKTEIEKQKEINEPKRLSKMDTNNRCLSRCREEDLQRNSLPSSWLIF